jgi:AdoMet-dependent heme synthase
MTKRFNLKHSPWMAIWETTQASNVACLDYDDCIRSQGDPLELTTEEAEQLIREAAKLGPRVFLLTGTDPLTRDDIYYLVNYAARLHLHPFLAASATPLLTSDAVFALKQSGLSRLVLTLNGSTAGMHDMISGVHGSYARTLEATQWAEQAKLPFHITTRLCRRNLQELEGIAALLKPFRIAQWSVAFPVPHNKAQMEQMPSPGQFEDAFASLYAIAQKVPFKIRTCEAQHYRRYVIQQQVAARANGAMQARQFDEGIPGILPVNDEQATIFISHNGEVFPSAHLPLALGNVRMQEVADIYRGSTVLAALRDPDNLKGKCRVCPFKQVCGGSRARAFAMNRDPFTEDPSCIYKPPQLEARAPVATASLPA